MKKLRSVYYVANWIKTEIILILQLLWQRILVWTWAKSYIIYSLVPLCGLGVKWIQSSLFHYNEIDSYIICFYLIFIYSIVVTMCGNNDCRTRVILQPWLHLTDWTRSQALVVYVGPWLWVPVVSCKAELLACFRHKGMGDNP